MSNVVQGVGVLRQAEGIRATEETLGDDGVTLGVGHTAQTHGTEDGGTVLRHMTGVDR